MREVADQLQRAATEPPGHFRHGAGVRPGADPAGRGAAVPAAQQLETSHHQPEGDQPPASDVTGRRVSALSGCSSSLRKGSGKSHAKDSSSDLNSVAGLGRKPRNACNRRDN